MNFKKVIAGTLSAGLIVSLGTGSLMVSAAENADDSALSEAKAKFDGGKLEFAAIDTFNFGSQQIIDSTEDYILKLNYDYTLSVRDLRGNGKGWRVDAQLNNFTDENNKDSLQSADLVMRNGSAVKPDDNADNKRPAIYDTAEIILESGADSTSKIAKAMGHEDILKAEGVGLWELIWAPNGTDAGVELKIPARSVSSGTHTSSVNWTLTSDMTTEQ